MPANLTPQYKEAEKRYRQAKTDDEKIFALEDMLALIPKHKGTEKLQGDIKKKLSRIKNKPTKKKGRRADEFHIQREGAGTCVVIGHPNSGKSSLIASVTNATLQIGSYPFATTRPVAGMMPFENIMIQLIDTPAVDTEFTKTWLASLLRNCDLVIFTFDLADESFEKNIDMTFHELDKLRI